MATFKWPWRAEVAFGVVLICLARFLVRNVRLSRWRWTLGRIDAASASSDGDDDHRADILASAIERAAERLPFDSKCLPRAVALQWRLRMAGIASRMVIAFHAIDRSGEHGFHAWVEHSGEMIIGACDRAVYRPALTLSQGNTAAFAHRT